LTVDAHDNCRRGGDGDATMFGTDAEGQTFEAEAEAEGTPVLGKARVDGEHSLAGPHTEESEGQGLPHPSHGGQVQALRRRSGAVVEVEAGSHSEHLERTFWLAGTSQERGMDRRG
jgi:hypothetical protein